MGRQCNLTQTANIVQLWRPTVALKITLKDVYSKFLNDVFSWLLW